MVLHFCSSPFLLSEFTPLPKYKLTIQYDGTAFYGWQLQAEERTVQGEIENALSKIYKIDHRIPIHGSGRTDTGVHAIGQVAHVELENSWDCNELKNAMNGNLPLDCRIKHIEEVSSEFQARFDATKRYYKYQCYTGDSLLFRNQSWQVDSLKLDILNKMAHTLIGDHDFLSYSKFRDDINHTRCIIYKSEWNLDGKMVIFTITGNRFLHHMVRYLVGTMIAVSQGKISIDTFIDYLHNPQKNVKIFKAPPQGLILEKVEYD